jgi:hypothetical protein
LVEQEVEHRHGGEVGAGESEDSGVAHVDRLGLGRAGSEVIVLGEDALADSVGFPDPGDVADQLAGCSP